MSNKSEATWHPNSGPEVQHADLIADLRGLADLLTGIGNRATLRRAADALAALGDTVPREQYDRQLGHRADDSRRHLTRARDAERERDEARAERDALAHVIEQVRNVLGATYNDCTWWSWIEDGLGGPLHGDLKRILDTAPAVSLALHDAEVKAQALEEAADTECNSEDEWVSRWSGTRADVIRKEAK